HLLADVFRLVAPGGQAVAEADAGQDVARRIGSGVSTLLEISVAGSEPGPDLWFAGVACAKVVDGGRAKNDVVVEPDRPRGPPLVQGRAQRAGKAFGSG